MVTAASIVNTLLESTGMFVSAVLTPESRSRLLARVPAVHGTVYAHHVTMAYNPDPALLARYQRSEGQHIRIKVTGMAQDEKGQAVLVEALSENKHPHITISCAEGVEPVYSNELLAAGKIERLEPSFTVEAVITIEPI